MVHFFRNLLLEKVRSAGYQTLWTVVYECGQSGISLGCHRQCILIIEDSVYSMQEVLSVLKNSVNLGDGKPI